MPKTKTQKVDPIALKRTATKAQQALVRLDDEYEKLDSEEQALQKLLDSLVEEEQSLEQALQLARQKPPTPVKPAKKKPEALARLESALMASSSSSDEESEEGES